jgi:serine phosphatase RsbU (regulator of sigma subunit)
MGERPVDVAVAARSYPGETVSGDAWQVDWDGPVCRIALVDGLGHGPEAAIAAAAATAHLAAHRDFDPETAIQGCHLALKGTRGAALLVARIEMADGRLTVAGVGNVEARLWQNGRAQQLLSDRGIVGSVLPTVRPIAVPLEPGWLFLAYTDGIRNRFDVDTLLQTTSDLNGIVQAILREWARANDDATVLAARVRHVGDGTRKA